MVQMQRRLVTIFGRDERGGLDATDALGETGALARR